MARNKFTSAQAKAAGSKSKRGAEKNRAILKEAISSFVTGEMDNVREAIEDLRKKDPKAYIDSMMRMMEYALPKLQRTEATVEQKQNEIKIRIID